MSKVISELVAATLVVLTLACTKEEGKANSGRDLVGLWVDVDHPADTLVIYKSEHNLLLFDNSMAFRTNPEDPGTRQLFTSIVRLNSKGIEVARVVLGKMEPDYRLFAFQWLQRGIKFTIEGDSFRPYLSCADCQVTYLRVK